jgi:hypothetical protein
MNKQTTALSRLNLKTAKKVYPDLARTDLDALRRISAQFQLSVSAGDIVHLPNGWYITSRGLLNIARRHRCHSIRVNVVAEYSDATAKRWAFKAIVHKSRNGAAFDGYGDADPTNVSPLVRGAEMRVAETRAVNRALRKAYGIGICSVEELGSPSGPGPSTAQMRKPAGKVESVIGNGYHPLRDRLCLLIRQHQLDPSLVKAYAADYCDVSELRRASREQVATFIKHLAEYAQSDREDLLSQLNSYAPKPASPAVNNISDSEPEKNRGAA